MRIAVLGLGYVGCVTAACLSDAGNTVIGIDPAVDKIEAINDGRAPIVEPGLGELIANSRQAGRISATTEISAVDTVDVAIVCVGTPSDDDGALDLKYVELVAKQIGERLSGRTSPLTIMLRSTSLPGTTQSKFIPWVQESSGMKEGVDFFVAFCPEFLRESSAISDFHNPPITVIGVESDGAKDRPLELFSFLGVEVDVVPTGVAEALKYSCNAFHAVKVAFANEISRVCQYSDVDARQVMALFVKDRELNISPRYLRPGFAYGGSCLPKDVAALQNHARQSGIPTPLVDSLTASNDAHINRVVDKVLESGATTVAQVGLTFKPSTDDLRESPFVKVAAALSSHGIKIRAYDPIIKLDRLVGANRTFIEAALPGLSDILVSTMEECLVDAQVVLLGTNAADVCDQMLAGPPVPVIDLSGMLPPRIETALRERKTHRPNIESYVGAAW
jgi:GDP-mannose 6-dehydrogenase